MTSPTNATEVDRSVLNEKFVDMDFDEKAENVAESPTGSTTSSTFFAAGVFSRLLRSDAATQELGQAES